MRFALMTDETFLNHRARHNHPERPERLRAILDLLDETGTTQSSVRVPAREARLSELERVHAAAHLAETLRALDRGWGNIDPDTFFSPGTREAALSAAGGTIDLARKVFRREAQAGFALNRPPGHHATRSRSMGFCLFNNIAAAAQALLDEEGAERVLIFDWDVHHGNGTQDIFYEDPRILFISVHQWPHFPGTGRIEERGRGPGLGFTVNVPFPAGATDGDYAALMERFVTPLADAFAPEAVLVSAGFDAHASDFLGSMRLSSEGFSLMAAHIHTLALKTGRGPCFVLEGGYDLSATARSVKTVIDTISGEHRPETPGPPSQKCLKVIEAVSDGIAATWPELRVGPDEV